MIFYFDEFQGGYSTDLPPERMDPNMLTTSENIYWKSKFLKRQGSSDLSTSDISAAVLQGSARARVNSINYTFLASETASGTVGFFYGLNGNGTLTEIDNTFSFATGEVELAVFGAFVIAVNGTDKPAVIYYDTDTSDIVILNLETYDTRTRTDSDWWAGQYDADGTTDALMYINDTTEAQTASVDFQLSSGVTGDGFFLAGDLTYNKVIFNDTGGAGTVDTTYTYYQGSDVWGTCDLVTTPDWSSSGDVTLEFNYPTDWAQYDGTNPTLNNRFAIRGSFTTPPAASVDCGLLQVYHTQYLTQIFGDERPKTVSTHLNRLYLGFDSIVNFSPPVGNTAGTLKGWGQFDFDIFEEGGPTVLAMRSMGEYLAIIKAAAIYGYFGNVWENREVRLLSTSGTTRGRTCAVVNDVLFFLAHDGVRAFTDLRDVIVSKHIKTDLDSYTKTNACATNYKGEYWLGFPSNDVMLWFDPDTFRTDDMGDGRVSFYKFPSLHPSNLVWHENDDDDDYLEALDNTSLVVKRYQDGAWKDGTVDISITAKYKPTSFGDVIRKKRYTRAKFETSYCGAFTFSIFGEYNETSHIVTGTTGTDPGTNGHYHTEYTVPYKIDGNNVGLEFKNTSSGDVTFYGFALEVFRREY